MTSGTSPRSRLYGDEKRSVKIKLSLSPSEKEQLDRLSESSGLSGQMVVRKLILSCPVPARPDPNILQLLSAVERLENDLAMLLWTLSSSGAEYANAASEAVRIMQEVKLETERWKRTWL